MKDSGKNKVFIIINPISGLKKKGLDKFKVLLNSDLDLNRYEPEIFVTKYAGHAGEITTQGLESGVRYFLVAGGDGTVNEVASIIVGTDAILGILPSGSGNGLAHHLKIPVNIPKAISVFNGGEVLRIDTCTVNDIFFASIAGIGFDAKVARQFAKSRRRGFFTYARIVFKEYFLYKSRDYVLKYDGKEIYTSAFFISFANSSQFGYNTRIAPNASITDGLIDICVVTKPPLVALPGITQLLVRQNIGNSKYMEITRASKIYVSRKKGKMVNVDGEPIKMKKELMIENQPASLNIVVPKK